MPSASGVPGHAGFPTRRRARRAADPPWLERQRPDDLLLSRRRPGGARRVRHRGTALSTDTAFALGILGTLGTRMPSRMRVFVLTVAVVDDSSPQPPSWRPAGCLCRHPCC
ncbi:Na+/H+ antiporter NhaA [Streptomyces olivaceoviridis]